MNTPRKRSRQIRLILLGGLASGALTGCGGDQAAQDLPPTQRVYPNDYYIEGIGYYHAPFGNWYQYTYNSAKVLKPGTPAMFYYGGQWGPRPYESIINLSVPNSEGVHALNRINDVRRGGFGSSYGGRSYFS